MQQKDQFWSNQHPHYMIVGVAMQISLRGKDRKLSLVKLTFSDQLLSPLSIQPSIISGLFKELLMGLLDWDLLHVKTSII
jgi:hypothetical protein